MACTYPGPHPIPPTGSASNSPIAASWTILRRDIHLGATTAAARQEASVLFDKGYRAFGPREMEESLLVGSPDDCIRHLDNMQRLGITHILFRPALRGQQQALQTMRLLGTEVMPHFRAHERLPLYLGAYYVSLYCTSPHTWAIWTPTVPW